jgi:multiple sugar transport system ATP-binding protein
MADVTLTSIRKTFKDVVALKKIDLEIKDKEFFVLLGPTGAGKTTMLRLVAGLESPDEGDIYLNEEQITTYTPAARDIAFVFQYYTLYPNYNVRQNLEFPLKSPIRNYPQDEINRRVEETAKTLHIEHLLDRETVHLSGGEMQRVGIGRAIVRTPRVFLMDEPLSNLDAKLREEMRSELSRLQKQLGQTFFYVTHDQTEALTMADRIGVLNEGEIYQIGTPDEIYYKPQNTFVAKTVGSPPINLLDVRYDDGRIIMGENVASMKVDEENASLLKKYSGQHIVLGIRPEDIRVTKEKPEQDSILCSIYFKQSMGAEDILNLSVEGVLIQATVPPSLQTEVGEDVYAIFDMQHAHLFDPETNKRIE